MKIKKFLLSESASRVSKSFVITKNLDSQFKGQGHFGYTQIHDFGLKSDFGHMGLTHSNIWEPPVFLDRIAISEIKTKIIYFHSQKSKSFIYENLLKTGFFYGKKKLF